MRSTFKTLAYLIIFMVFTMESINAAVLYFQPEAYDLIFTCLSKEISRPVSANEIPHQTYLNATQSPAALLLSAWFMLKLIHKLFPKKTPRQA